MMKKQSIFLTILLFFFLTILIVSLFGGIETTTFIPLQNESQVISFNVDSSTIFKYSTSYDIVNSWLKLNKNTIIIKNISFTYSQEKGVINNVFIWYEKIAKYEVKYDNIKN